MGKGGSGSSSSSSSSGSTSAGTGTSRIIAKYDQVNEKKDGSNNKGSHLNNFQLMKILNRNISSDADQRTILYDMAKHIAASKSNGLKFHLFTTSTHVHIINYL